MGTTMVRERTHTITEDTPITMEAITIKTEVIPITTMEFTPTGRRDGVMDHTATTKSITAGTLDIFSWRWRLLLQDPSSDSTYGAGKKMECQVTRPSVGRI